MSAYSTRYYEGLKEDSAVSAREVVPLLLGLVPAKSVVDVGCGSGTWAQAYAQAGCEVLGIDGEIVQVDQLLIPGDRFLRKDLAQRCRNSEIPLRLSMVLPATAPVPQQRTTISPSREPPRHGTPLHQNSDGCLRFI